MLTLLRKTGLAVAVPLLLFVALELVLLVVGVEPATDRDPFVGFASVEPLFVKEQSNGRTWWVTASNKLDYFNPQRFPAGKGGDTYRIFCLGGSTTYGRPYEDVTSFCGWLRELLPAVQPSRRWEVLNAGGISYASYRVVELMKELNRYDPDLYVVYTGHNEFLEERTYAAVRRLPQWLRNTGALLGRTRTYALMDRALAPVTHGGDAGGRDVLAGEVEAILDRSVGLDAYRRDDALRRHVVEHLARNLERMVDLAEGGRSETPLHRACVEPA
ncbi:MAG: SGNH/GDSL hydrolase family protein [Kiritimatiellia bacterium]